MAFRTQKISQMTPKGADLEATDLIEVSTLESGSYVTRSITGQELIDAIPPTTVDWGDIGGTLSAQTDLNTALNGKVPTSRTLTINGVTQDLSADRTYTIATGLTVGTTPIASGTVGRILFEGTGNVLQESANLFWDNTNARLGIGTATPSGRFHVKGSVASEIFKAESTIAALYAQFVSSDGACEFGIYTDALYFQPLPSLANGTRFLNGGNTIIMQLAQTGNVGINTTTDAGFKLDVNGTARVQGLTTLSGTMTASSAIARNQLINGTLVAAANGDTLVGLDINPTFNNGAFTGVTNYGIRSYLNISGIYDGLQIRNTAAAANAQSRIKFDNDITPTQTSTGGVIFYTSSAFSGFPSNSFGLWNYNSSGVIALATNATERMRIFSTGNVGINTTTDAGFKLDVNGTARVTPQGSTTAAVYFQSHGFYVNRTRLFVGVSDGANSNQGFQINVNSSSGFTSLDGWNDGGSAQYDIVIGNAGSRTQFGTSSTSVASAQVAINTTTRGFLPPRMTTTQKNAIATPAAGLVVYDTTLNKLCVYTTAWETVTSL
jgi:hypothetical protein